MRLLYFLFLIIQLSFHTHIHAENNSYKYKTLDIEDGLSNSSINCFLQDSHGFMWIGTMEGLNRYNGYEFELFFFTPGDSSSLSNNIINSLAEDKHGNVWIGTKKGLNRFDHDEELIERYLLDTIARNGIHHNHVGVVFSDSKDNIWIGTMGGGLDLYLEQTNSFKHFPVVELTNNQINSSNIISAGFEGSEGDLWLGTFGNGICSFNPESKTYNHFPQEGMEVNDILDDGLGSVWIGTNNKGLFRFDKEKKEYEKFILGTKEEDRSFEVIKCLSLDKDSNLVITSNGGGLAVIDPVKKVRRKENGKEEFFEFLDTKAIDQIFIDTYNFYWIGTATKGVKIFNPERNSIVHYRHSSDNPKSLSEDAIVSCLQDRKGRIWIGTNGGGLNLFNEKNGTFKHYKGNYGKSFIKGNEVIKRIFEDSSNNLWIGAYDGGLSLFNTKTELFETYFVEKDITESAPDSKHVWAIAEKDSNHLIIGTLGGGLFLFDKRIRKFEAISDKTTGQDVRMNQYVLDLLKDKNGCFWIATSNGVYTSCDNFATLNKLFSDENNDSGMGESAVVDLFEGRDGNIWMGTNGGGVRLFSPDFTEKRHIRKEDGLPNEKVFSILQDEFGYLWFITRGGLSRYDSDTNKIQNYDSNDGLNGNVLSCGIVLNHGELLIGGKGLNKFDPLKIKANDISPQVLITGLYLNNVKAKVGDPQSPLIENIIDTKKLELPFSKNTVRLDFLSINHYNSEKNLYSYMLEGFNDTWSLPSTQRNASFTSLRPGKYIFKVKAKNRGVWSTEESHLEVIVLTPWWRSLWAFIIYVIIMALLITAYIRYSLQWIDLKRRLNFEIIERERIKELNQLRLQFFTNISHEFRTPLTLIIGPLESLLKKTQQSDESQKSLKLIHRNAMILFRLINQLLDFRKIETESFKLDLYKEDIVDFVIQCCESFRFIAKEKKIDFAIESDVRSIQTNFDPDILEKVIYNLLSNAFKFTEPSGSVSLRIEEDEKTIQGEHRRCIVLKVKDTGKGIAKEHLQEVFKRYKQFKTNSNSHQPGTGIGLALSYSLVKLHGGLIEVESQMGKGSVFSVFIPLEEVEIAKDSKNEIIDLEGQIKISQTINTSDKPAATFRKEAESPSSRQNKILVVDDSEDILTYLDTLLNPNYRLFFARDGVEAFAIAKKEIPDLVIADVMMPNMDGIELCDHLKNEIRTSHIPIILLSAKSAIENRIEGLNTGADAYVAKPFNPDYLETYIENLLASRDKLKEYFAGKTAIVPSEITSSGLDEQFITKAIEIIKDNAHNESFSIEELGHHLGMSRSNLHRKMKALTGKSTSDFIRSIRLKEAAVLLQTGDYQISEIAYKVGFNSSSYFIKSFKKEFNMSPGQYKTSKQKLNHTDI